MVAAASRSRWAAVVAELAGMLGVDWIESVRDAAPGTTVLLVTNDLTDALNDRAMHAGAFGIVHTTRLEDLNGALGRAHRCPGQQV